MSADCLKATSRRLVHTLSGSMQTTTTHSTYATYICHFPKIYLATTTFLLMNELFRAGKQSKVEAARSRIVLVQSLKTYAAV